MIFFIFKYTWSFQGSAGIAPIFNNFFSNWGYWLAYFISCYRLMEVRGKERGGNLRWGRRWRPNCLLLQRLKLHKQWRLIIDISLLHLEREFRIFFFLLMVLELQCMRIHLSSYNVAHSVLMFGLHLRFSQDQFYLLLVNFVGKKVSFIILLNNNVFVY